jgi:sugar phosphate isomerase/epimerase
MDRRAFLSTMTAATVLGKRLSWAVENHSIPKVGVQLYTVRDLMKTDFEGTLQKVAAVGYREVEFAGYFDRTAQQVKAVLAKSGMVSPSAHFDYSYLGDKWPGVLEGAKVVGHEYIVCPSVDENLRKTLDGWKQVAATLNRAGETAKKAGIQFAYHNHWWEFGPIEGKVPYDLLLKETDAALVKMEMDLYWAVKAGADPKAYFDENPGRFPMVHVKGRAKDGSMTEVAADNAIDWKRLFSDEKAGIRHYFVEHDQPKSPLESIRASYEYLAELRF